MNNKHWHDLKGDLYRQIGTYGFLELLKKTLFSRTFRVIATMRICKAFDEGKFSRPFLWFFILLHRISSSLAGVDFPWKAIIGRGIALTHGWGVVINEGVTIGNNVTIMHGVTLGQRDRITVDGKRSTLFPIIEDEVWLGPNSTVVGGITIGKGSRICAGALVLEDVPQYSIVMGNPSRVVKQGCKPDVLNPC